MEGLQLKILVQVKTNAKSTKIISQDNNNYFISLKSLPINNKANEELIKFLKKTFKKEIILKSGKTSKKKVLEIVD